MKTDIEIAQSAQMLSIAQVAEKAGIDVGLLEHYGRVKAKIDIGPLRDRPRKGKLILVTAINPTPAGEGKTTTSVGLADALSRLDKNVLLCLREPSLGPVFGVKGAGTPRWCPWRTSTSTSPGTSTPSARPTTCWRPCWTTTSSRGTPWALT